MTDRATLSPQTGRKDPQLVRPDGGPVGQAIEGVLARAAITHADERGEVTEILSNAWPDTLGREIPHVYLATVQPGVIKGWICHKSQYDRSFILFGRLRWTLYDGRPDSPTVGVIQQLTFTERNRHLVVVPPGVWHAVENVGATEAMFVNLPTRMYDHMDPDKYRLPLDTDEIPFRLNSRQ
jgi:dTDP-4-dehydrorhamnose 3,5-epimerase